MRAVCLFLLVLALSACASAVANHSSTRPALSPLLRSNWSPAPEQSCTLLGVPTSLGDPASLLDASTVEQVLAFGEGEGSAPYAVLEVLFDSTGARTRAAVVESNLSLAAQQMLTGAVTAYVEPISPEARKGWGVLLKVAAGRPAAMGQMEYCACSLTNCREVQRLMQSAASRIRDPRLAGTQQVVVVDVRSDSLGNILKSVCSRSRPTPLSTKQRSNSSIVCRWRRRC